MWEVLVRPKLCPGLEPHAGLTNNTVLLSQTCQYQTSTCLLSCLILSQSKTLPLQAESILESVPHPAQPGVSLRRTAPSLVAQLLSN